MDPFEEEQIELTGSLISMEFNASGRISGLWATNPSLPDERDDFQFVLPPISFGEETAEDYYPGTVLLGARLSTDSPWILSRNSTARISLPYADDLDNSDPSTVQFDYFFPLLPEIQAIGRFYETTETVPQIVWEIELRNESQSEIELGELAFPLAFNNYYHGFNWNDNELRSLWASRLYIHPFIGGAASWIFVQRMNSEPPGLLIFPGENTSWEFFTHVPASLNTPFQWEGIPVVYIYSRAIQEREGWPEWANGHRSLVLRPGDSRSFEMRFVPTVQDSCDGIFQTLAICKRPAIRLYPSAVSPAHVGIATEIMGATSISFETDRPAKLETDADENSSFCYVKTKDLGPLTLTIMDTQGRVSHVHLMIIDRLEKLIKKRAEWILKHQVVTDPNSPFYRAILMANIDQNSIFVNPEEFQNPLTLEGCLADTLYLSQKNTIYPVKAQIKVLDDFISVFLSEKIQNPGDYSIASILDPSLSIGLYPGRPMNYPLVFGIYHSMYQIAKTYGETSREPKEYLFLAYETARALFRFGWRNYVWNVGILLFTRIYQIQKDLLEEGFHQEAEIIQELIYKKAHKMTSQKHPFSGESLQDATAYQEVYQGAVNLLREQPIEKTFDCLFSARSLAPSWWWYGSDKRCWEYFHSTNQRNIKDHGELCLAHTTIPNSLVFFEALDRDYQALPESYLRAALGGILGPWALVREDGAASMSYCPDPYSKLYGHSSYTGSSGIGYAEYLAFAGSYVLPSIDSGNITFGCHFEENGEFYSVKPWDGVGKKIIMRQIGAEFGTTFGCIHHLKLDIKKKWFEIDIQNPSDKTIATKIHIRGLWGKEFLVEDTRHFSKKGTLEIEFNLPAREISHLSGKVIT